MSQLIQEAKLEPVTRGQIVAISFVGIIFFINLVLFPMGFEVLLIPLILGVGSIFFGVWVKTFTTLQIFEDRVELLGTFLVKSSRRIEASKIESVNFTESLLGRHRYGGLTIRGSGMGALVVSPIQAPEKVAEAIRGIADKSASKAPSKSTSVGSGGDTQSLAELIHMKEQGHLTDAEFTAAKKKLLG